MKPDLRRYPKHALVACLMIVADGPDVAQAIARLPRYMAAYEAAKRTARQAARKELTNPRPRGR